MTDSQIKPEILQRSMPQVFLAAQVLHTADQRADSTIPWRIRLISSSDTFENSAANDGARPH
ncbi:hypothetical protein ACFX5Q_07440 [Mesorhizobium sp. IMUNJ 23033]|uniref:hypothetical protein n=1 Tax=Mesorhizobium sp. IMUNJ 23033 TaxID=3378039 RepID=UPI00384E416D